MSWFRRPESGAFSRQRTGKDPAAGLATVLVTIPDGLASAVLAGLHPVHGLHSRMVATPIAVLAMRSPLMSVANTGAIVAVRAAQGIGISECSLRNNRILRGFGPVYIAFGNRFLNGPSSGGTTV